MCSLKGCLISPSYCQIYASKITSKAVPVCSKIIVPHFTTNVLKLISHQAAGDLTLLVNKRRFTEVGLCFSKEEVTYKWVKKTCMCNHIFFLSEPAEWLISGLKLDDNLDETILKRLGNIKLIH